MNKDTPGHLMTQEGATYADRLSSGIKSSKISSILNTPAVGKSLTYMSSEGITQLKVQPSPPCYSNKYTGSEYWPHSAWLAAMGAGRASVYGCVLNGRRGQASKTQ